MSGGFAPISTAIPPGAAVTAASTITTFPNGWIILLIVIVLLLLAGGITAILYFYDVWPCCKLPGSTSLKCVASNLNSFTNVTIFNSLVAATSMGRLATTAKSKLNRAQIKSTHIIGSIPTSLVSVKTSSSSFSSRSQPPTQTGIPLTLSKRSRGALISPQDSISSTLTQNILIETFTLQMIVSTEIFGVDKFATTGTINANVQNNDSAQPVLVTSTSNNPQLTIKNKSTSPVGFFTVQLTDGSGTQYSLQLILTQLEGTLIPASTSSPEVWLFSFARIEWEYTLLTS